MLGERLTGVYLRGSLALGDFDPETSDIDFLAATAVAITEKQFSLLQDLHARIADRPNPYAKELEGAYIDVQSLRRYRPNEKFPTIARGESLQWAEHGANWVLERWAVREHGISLWGPEPRTLIDPVSTEDIRRAVSVRLQDWSEWAEWASDMEHPAWLLPLSHKAYVVETMCRALYTLETGGLCSKRHAVDWACAMLPDPWRRLVRQSRAWSTNLAIPERSVISEVARFVRWAASMAD
ncbi:aminoglycoside adenylyltransferase domain-containing protein [Paenibacillus sp.]|uniref:aminoglycoside adenylyltransferase domain-containing protein n=1 Tax=Paenibacillus sp. TaxID=58172 RepID=UPI002D4B0D9E|nr:aminoglycoside adenylyltransferase domain-containing protein [Paenibacillus sp.]HZG83698.1 aminoglycoside adenylyltransferase domain-containing protein [Paenibacillus sp.]